MNRIRYSFGKASSWIRRCSSQSHNAGSSIWSNYNRLLSEHPLVTKSLTSGVLSFLADAICQTYFPEKKGKAFDWRRLFNFTILGTALVGPLLHYWYGFLMLKIPAKTAIATVQRVALDQLVFAPFCIIPAIFSCAMILEGTPEKIPAKIQADWGPTLLTNFAVWIPAQMINFKFMIPQYQVLFANSVGFFWNIYLSSQTNKTVPVGDKD